MVAVYYCDLEDYELIKKDSENYKVKKMQVVKINGKIKQVFKVNYHNRENYNNESAPMDSIFYKTNENIQSLEPKFKEDECKTIIRNGQTYIL